jgi:hypothetical protein
MRGLSYAVNDLRRHCSPRVPALAVSDDRPTRQQDGDHQTCINWEGCGFKVGSAHGDSNPQSRAEYCDAVDEGIHGLSLLPEARFNKYRLPFSIGII